MEPRGAGGKLFKSRAKLYWTRKRALNHLLVRGVLGYYNSGEQSRAATAGPMYAGVSLCAADYSNRVTHASG